MLFDRGLRARNPAAAAAKSAGRRSRPAPGMYKYYKRGNSGVASSVNSQNPNPKVYLTFFLDPSSPGREGSLWTRT